MAANIRFCTVLALILSVHCAGCSESGPALAVTDVVVLAPVPGSTVSVAYLTFHNRGKQPMIIREVSSSEFGKVDMHESLSVDDVVRMGRLESLTLEAGESTQFAAGGKHLMLMEPKAGLIPGTPITLMIEYDDDGMLIVNATLKTRD